MLGAGGGVEGVAVAHCTYSYTNRLESTCVVCSVPYARPVGACHDMSLRWLHRAVSLPVGRRLRNVRGHCVRRVRRVRNVRGHCVRRVRHVRPSVRRPLPSSRRPNDAGQSITHV